MKAVVQRVKRAGVRVGDQMVGKIDQGLLVLVGVCKDDADIDVEILASKLSSLRIFSDEQGKMNRSVLNIGGGILAVSNFTLCADVKKGTRPSFDPAMPPVRAEKLYDAFCRQLQNCGVGQVEKGVFGADMEIDLINDGPVTLTLDTRLWRKL